MFQVPSSKLEQTPSSDSEPGTWDSEPGTAKQNLEHGTWNRERRHG